MLDNMAPAQMKEAVSIIKSKAPHIVVEGSGSVTPQTIKAMAETGVDVISVGRSDIFGCSVGYFSLDLNEQKGDGTMILVIDVGNTNIVLGLYQERTLLHHWRVSTNRSATVDEYGMQLHSLISTLGHLHCTGGRCHYFFCCSAVDECDGKPLFTIFETERHSSWVLELKRD